MLDFDKKVSDINKLLSENIKAGDKVVIWGGGEHTMKLLLHSNILMYNPDIIDKYNYGLTQCNILVKPMHEYDFSDVDVVIISTIKYQNVIEEELREKLKFKKIIIKLYATVNDTPFYMLQNKNMFLTLNGEYSNWERAQDYCKDGYASNDIFKLDMDEAKQHQNMYLEGEKYNQRYYYDILMYIYEYAIRTNKVQIKILDYGGGFGTVYYDLKHFFDRLPLEFIWIIMDQKKVSEYGKKYFEDNNLKFAMDFDETEKYLDGKCDIVIFGSCLQYIKDYKDIENKCISFDPELIMILKTPVSEKSMIKVQSVNENRKYNYYSAKYPLNIFNENDLLKVFSEKYKKIDEHDDIETPNNNLKDNVIVTWKTFFLEKK